ncbi:hypothetical protein E2C01_025839 [Portunus trituberculatus]|uniref:Uncharacterized protein n=1 Tax=Portunus trituberculatus TaxID=210409 RepID=A0A5B7EH79_PORTR|nr:hypothetical protein [Portunus trituberculatus]
MTWHLVNLTNLRSWLPFAFTLSHTLDLSINNVTASAIFHHLVKHLSHLTCSSSCLYLREEALTVV